MFNFVIKYLGFLKPIPLLPLVFDGMLRLHMLVFKPSVLRWIDEIEAELLQWEGVNTSNHKYGGLQFNYRSSEIGHIHSNGLLDILLNTKIKEQLIPEGRVTDHHSFKRSGWISFSLRTNSDKLYALELLKIAYHLRTSR